MILPLLHTIVPHLWIELGCIRIAPLMLDRDARRLYVHGHEVNLSRVEFDLLELLMDRPRHVIDRHTLKQVGWNGYCADRTLESTLSRLRVKVRRAGGPSVAEVVRGVGYRLGIPCPPKPR